MNDSRIYTVVFALKNSKEFSSRDALLLAHQIRANWDPEKQLRIICINDKVKKETELTDLTFVPANTDWPRWWIKMNAVEPEFIEKYGPFLLLDLDTAVVGDLSKIFPLESENNYITLEDFYRKGVAATALVYVPKDNEKLKKIWKAWIVSPARNMAAHKLKGDMGFMASIAMPDEFFQERDSRIYSFKPRPSWLKEIPDEAIVICFHGKPRIWDAALTVDWVREYIEGIC